MAGASIQPGNLVAADCARRPADGSTVAAVVKGEHTIKRLRYWRPRTVGACRWLCLPIPAW